MPAVPIKFVVSFSSQDKHFVANNITRRDGCQKWLSSSDDKSSRLEGVFQLERSCKISHIDIGTQSAFTAEVLVGRSSWALSQEFISLVPACTLLKPADCRLGNNKTTMRMLKYDDFSCESRDEPWDRIKLVLTQPFKKDLQFGVTLLKVVTEEQLSPEQTNKMAPLGNSAFENLTPQQVKKASLSSSAWTSPAALLHSKMLQGKLNRDKKDEGIKSQLAKIGASAENGSEQSAVLSRTAKMVMAATEKIPKYKQSSPPPSIPAAKRQRKMTFTEEVVEFLNGLDLENLNLDNLKFSDLRHMLEKRKCRKLSKEERKVFFKAAQNFITEVLDCGDDSDSKKKTNLMTSHSIKVANNVYQNSTEDMSDCFGCEPNSSSKTTARPKSQTVSSPSGTGRLGKCSIQSTSSAQSASNNQPTKAVSENVLKKDAANTPLTPKKQALMNQLLNRYTEGKLNTFTPGSGKVKGKRKKKAKVGAGIQNTTDVWLSAGTPPPKHSSQDDRDYTEMAPGGSRGRNKMKSPKSRNKTDDDDASFCRKMASIQRSNMVSCPICKGQYAQTVIQAHSLYCGIVMSSDESDKEAPDQHQQPPASRHATVVFSQDRDTPIEEMSDCPLCLEKFPISVIEEHANMCLELNSL